MKKIFVVFPVHNGLEETKAFLVSMRTQHYENYKVIVCDDGSTDGTAEYLRLNYPEVAVLPGTGNLWWTGGINVCVRHALEICSEGDYILTINNDVTIDPHYLQQKMARAEEYPSTIIGSLCMFMNDPTLIETSGIVVDFDKCRLSPVTKTAEKRSAKHVGVMDVTTLPGKGVLIPVEVFRKIGLYDEKNLPHYHADTDLILMAYEAGYRVLLDYDSVIYSDVNYKNMTIPSEMMTIGNILKTFRGPYSHNNYSIIRSFAKKHFGRKWKQYLIKKYIRIIGGLTIRYLAYRKSRIAAMFYETK